MSQKRILMSLMVGFFLLLGTNVTFAALWDRPCQVAIEDLQYLQQQIATKKQEVDQARVASTIPASFIADHLQDSIGTDRTAQAVKELKSLFEDAEVAFSELSQWCLASHRASK